MHRAQRQMSQGLAGLGLCLLLMVQKSCSSSEHHVRRPASLPTLLSFHWEGMCFPQSSRQTVFHQGTVSEPESSRQGLGKETRKAVGRAFSTVCAGEGGHTPAGAGPVAPALYEQRFGIEK